VASPVRRCTAHGGCGCPAGSPGGLPRPAPGARWPAAALTGHAGHARPGKDEDLTHQLQLLGATHTQSDWARTCHREWRPDAWGGIGEFSYAATYLSRTHRGGALGQGFPAVRSAAPWCPGIGAAASRNSCRIASAALAAVAHAMDPASCSEAHCPWGCDGGCRGARAAVARWRPPGRSRAPASSRTPSSRFRRSLPRTG
jgi:hypothetical protein